MPETAAIIWRDGPASQPTEPQKSQIRAWGTWLEGLVTAFTSNGGLIYSSLALLNADLARSANTMAWVYGDPVAANNGVYGKVGASGTGSWTRRSDLPFSFIVATDTGAGTPNAIVATSGIPVSSSALVILNVFETNTNSPITVSFNGGSPLTVKTNSGDDLTPGGLTAGMRVLGVVSGSTFRLVNDEAIATLIYAARDDAEAARDASEGFRDDAAASAAVVSGLASAFIIGENTFASRTVAMAWHPVAAPDYIRTAGYAVAGDLGAALYKKVGSQPSHAGKFSITLSGGGVVWYEIADATLTPQMFGAVADGVTDSAPGINAAIQFAYARGGGTVWVPFGNYLVKSTVSTAGGSNLIFKGSGWGSKIIASADLNASDNLTKNDIISALNFSGPVTSSAGYPQKNIVISDLLLDGSLQNLSGLPGGATYGYSLAGIEFLNVDFAIVERVKFVNCFGNGLVFGTQNPRQKNGAFQNGVRGCRARDNVFENCVRGLLPQYATAAAPSGITGSVIQIGSSLDGVIENNLILTPGGPAIDIFNAEGASIKHNSIIGASVTAVGASPLNATFYQQSIGTIRSDFGLVNCSIEDNFFDKCGGILLNGYMGLNFFNDNIPTTGPVGCTIKGNKMREPTGRIQIAAPTLGASGAQYDWTYSQAGRVVLIGGTGVSVTRRRGTDGSFVAQTLGADASFPVASGDAYKITYTTAPTVVWYLAPNIFEPAIRLLGGSISGTSGQAQRNIVKDNIIFNAGRYGINLIDVYDTIIEGNVIENVGLAEAGMSFVVMENSLDQAGTGCQEINIIGNSFLDSRSPKFASSNVVDVRVGATVRTVKNRVMNNRLEATISASLLNLAQDNYISSNFGPGWKSPVLSSPAVPASNAELLNPFPYDCDVIILGGTVTAIAKGPALATQVYGATGGLCRVRQGEVIKITYSVAPTAFNWFAA